MVRAAPETAAHPGSISVNYSALHDCHMNESGARVLNAYKCLRLLHEIAPFRSVVDFGCGIGGWLAAAKQLGAQKVLGIEGDWISGRKTLIDPSEMTIRDLAKEPPKLDRSFDLAVSIEVAEHLPAEAADRFCDALVSASELIVFSAAIPGQGGENHVNEQKPRYWVDKFWQRNFVPLEVVRPAIAGDPGMFPWLKQNVIVFSSYQRLCARDALKRFMMPREHFYNRYWPM
jgi:SAM-dependent methyltransferase